MELAEDIEQIAQKTLHQRMLRELSKTLLRFAVKKGSEYALRKEDKTGLANLLSFVNATTEKADTRAWHTIPHSIYYTRLRLPAGKHDVQLHKISEENRERTINFHFEIGKGESIFHSFHSLEVHPSYYRSYARGRY